MKKIMFNSRYGIEQAVLEGRKTQTRRLVQNEFFTLQWDVRDDTLVVENEWGDFIDIRNTKYCMFRIGEVVAIAQSYLNIAEELENCSNASCAEHFENNIRDASWYMGSFGHPGFRNKMFTSADRMIHQIRITNVRIERLQDISDKDCLAEGIIKGRCGSAYTHFMDAYYVPNETQPYCTPKDAYAELIDKVSGEGTWQKNPYVFVYDFELVK